MKTPLAVIHLLREQFGIAQIAPYILDIKAGQGAHVAFGPYQRLHLVLARDQFMNQVCPNETRSACNETSHIFADVIEPSNRRFLHLFDFGIMPEQGRFCSIQSPDATKSFCNANVAIVPAKAWSPRHCRPEGAGRVNFVAFLSIHPLDLASRLLENASVVCRAKVILERK
jgi:hypothetical protein